MAPTPDDELDLWGELDSRSPDERLPADLLRQQAARLGAKTGGIVTARVESSAGGGRLAHALLLEAPRLAHFSHRLLTLEHGVAPYPVVPAGDDTETAPLASEAELIAWLGHKLAAPETRTVIHRLAAYAAGQALTASGS